MIPSTVEKTIHQVLTKKITLRNFEQWLYENNALESDNPNLYFELISFNYSSKNSFKDFYELFANYTYFYKFEADRIKEYLYSIINKDENCADAILIMYDLYCDGYGFLGKLGIVYGFSIVDYSTSSSSNNVNDILGKFYPNIIKDAQEVINWLNEKKIIFKSEETSYGGFEYDDFRSEVEILQGKA